MSRRGGRLGPAWVAELERIRAARLTSIHVVEAVIALSQLHPLDRWTYCEAHRSDWDKRAELPPSRLLIALAERIPGARLHEPVAERGAA